MTYDVCVIGGGVNGTGIARDLSGRGLKVLLLEKDDLASGTSSNSTKLIHGGLRYLESYDFKLVRESLQERSRLLKLAPHIIWPLRFILPHVPSLRPRWMIRAGLFLYDHLADRGGLERSRALRCAENGPLKPEYDYAFSYADCWVEDSRLVVLSAMDARARGAHILTRTPCTGLQPQKDGWQIQTPDNVFLARVIVNAAGPWVSNLLSRYMPGSHAPKLKLSKGSHIIVPRIAGAEDAYLLQQPDGRVVFAIPYEQRFTLIGTTDVPVSGDPSGIFCTQDEKDYLLQSANRFFKVQLSGQDIIHTYSGVRPLLDDGQSNLSKVTRDYKIYAERIENSSIVTLIGGKLTTFRTVSEHVANEVCSLLGIAAEPWTAEAPLPGGDIEDIELFIQQQIKAHPHVSPHLIRRYARAYGMRMVHILTYDRGRDLGDGVYEAELDYLRKYEWAQTAEDVLWRRSKLGLHVSASTKEEIERFFA